MSYEQDIQSMMRDLQRMSISAKDTQRQMDTFRRFFEDLDQNLSSMGNNLTQMGRNMDNNIKELNQKITDLNNQVNQLKSGR